MIENQIISQLKVNYFNVEVMVFRLVKSQRLLSVAVTDVSIKGSCELIYQSQCKTQKNKVEMRGRRRGGEGDGEGEGGSYFMRGK